jgi:hypothetical protein
MVGQRDVRLKSELGFAMRMRDKDVHSRLFAGKEERAEGVITDDSRGHSGLGANVEVSGLRGFRAGPLDCRVGAQIAHRRPPI